MLLKKKLLHLGKINQIWKLKDSEKIVEALSKMINTMMNLEQQLAYEHNIHARLYNQAFIEALLSTAVFPRKIQFLYCFLC